VLFVTIKGTGKETDTQTKQQGKEWKENYGYAKTMEETSMIRQELDSLMKFMKTVG
jgi:hypothetical protein